MPVYNREKFVAESMRSVLAQTFSDFELLIIDDGSTDKSMEITQSFNDPRIRIIKNEGNTGLVAVRNKGIKESRGEFIALLDSDDLMVPSRLEKQYNFLSENPEFGMIGTGVKLIDEKGKETGVIWKEKIPPEKIPIRLLFNNCFTQSSVMMRKNALPEERYREGFAPAEDYELWARIAETSKVWNLPEVLTLYRIHGENISSGGISKKYERGSGSEKVTRRELLRLGITPTPEDLQIHRTNYHYPESDIKDFLEKKEKWLLKLIKANEETRAFSDKLFKEVSAEIFLSFLSANSRLGLFAWKRFRQSPLSPYLNKKESLPKLLKFAIKSLLKI